MRRVHAWCGSAQLRSATDATMRAGRRHGRTTQLRRRNANFKYMSEASKQNGRRTDRVTLARMQRLRLGTGDHWGT